MSPINFSALSLCLGVLILKICFPSSFLGSASSEQASLEQLISSGC